MAEGMGFEPTVGFPTQHFQCCTIGLSVNPLKVERLLGIEPRSSAWKAEVIAIIRCTHIVLTSLIMPHLTENETFFFHFYSKCSHNHHSASFSITSVVSWSHKV